LILLSDRLIVVRSANLNGPQRTGEKRKETEIFHGFSDLSFDGPPALSIADSR